MSGIDARRGFERAGNEMDRDRYATDVFTEEARKIIEASKRENTKMFLMVSHLAVHSGNSGPNHLEVLNKTYNDEAFGYIENENRRLYAGENNIVILNNGTIFNFQFSFLFIFIYLFNQSGKQLLITNSFLPISQRFFIFVPDLKQ